MHAQQYRCEAAQIDAVSRDELGGVSTGADDRNRLSAANKSERTQPDAVACEIAGEEIRTPDVQLGKTLPAIDAKPRPFKDSLIR